MNSYKYTSEMKVPTRPAPPPPTGGSSWSSSIFNRDKNQNQKNSLPKRKPPPRPPPPKFTQPRPEARGSHLVAGIFPPSQSRSINEPAGSLIDWSSPPSSPTSTTRSSSDAISVNSFGSDSVTPSSGSTSNVESGFEDDFELFGAPSSRAPDPWSPTLPAAKAPAPKSSWVTFSPSVPKKLNMPTIIRVKPERPKVPKVLEKKLEMVELEKVFQNTMFVSNPPVDYEEDRWSSDSPPMPTCPPPAPPPELLAELLEESIHPKCIPTEQGFGGDTAVALFDYHGAPGDLSFRRGDRVRIIRRIDEHWVDASLGSQQGVAPVNHLQMEETDQRLATALYKFPAETWEDLALEPGLKVRLLGRVNNDWLYGEANGKRGQFPTSFVNHVPADLPPWNC